MYMLLQLLVIILAFFISLAQAVLNAAYEPQYTSVVAPINKHIDAAKPLYSVHISAPYVNNQYMDANFLIDIDAPFMWHDCIAQAGSYPGSCPSNRLCTGPITSIDSECTIFQTSYSSKNPSCPLETNSTLPGWSFNTCLINVISPVTGLCSQGDLVYDYYTLRLSNGRNVGTDFFSNFYGAFPNTVCAPSSSFESFPANVSGVMPFSSSPYALPAYLYQPRKKRLALCLPSKPSAPGVLFFGTGPYYLLPQSKVDVRRYLSYTPLLKHPDSFGYFINVTSIVIKTRSINVPVNATTKLSTIDPYTILRTDIYNGVLRRFSKVTKRIPSARPVAPFGLCYSTSTSGLNVPDIDFVLPEGKKWTISTTNSIKQITSEVACLAFVDGGATSEPAIVIGTFQFEDNFLEFNLENSTFGFSSSLLRKRTSCANFNFTITHIPPF